MTYKTKGIIIKRRNFGEADRILTIYTRDFGKISAIAKGVRKPLSKLGGYLELFYLNDMVLTEGRNFDIVTGAVVLNDYPKIRENHNKINQAFFISELLNVLIKEEEKSEEIFNLSRKTIEKLDTSSNKLLLSYFILKLLDELGHSPEISHCVKCRKSLEKGINYFSIILGGVLCDDCRKFDLGAKNVSVNAIKLMRIMLENDIQILDKLNPESDLIMEVNRIFNQFAEDIAERKINSLKYLDNPA